jgi:hypothetical protein
MVAGVSSKITNISDRREPEYSGVIQAASEIASKRRALLLRLKAARVANNVDLVFEIVDELVPDSVLNSHDKEMPTTVARFNRRASR